MLGTTFLSPISSSDELLDVEDMELELSELCLSKWREFVILVLAEEFLCLFLRAISFSWRGFSAGLKIFLPERRIWNFDSDGLETDLSSESSIN